MTTVFKCIPIPPLVKPDPIPLPGGMEIGGLNVLEKIDSALAPFDPIFKIIGVVDGIIKCFKATLEILKDPTALKEAVEELMEKAMELAKLVPQLSVPFTIVAVIDLIIKALGDVIRELSFLEREMTQVAERIDFAKNAELDSLLETLLCKQADIAQEAMNLATRLAALGKLVSIINLLLTLLGIPEEKQIPDFAQFEGQGLGKLLVPLEAIHEALVTVREAVPV